MNNRWNTLKKRQKQSNKTIPKSIWKPPRDKKSNDEPNNTTKGVQNLETSHQKGGWGTPAHEQTIEPRGLGGLPLTCGVNLSRRGQNSSPPPGTVPKRSLDRPGCETHSNSIFDRKFWQFLCLRRRFEAILDPKTGLRRVLRTCFSAFFSRRSFASIFRRFLGKNM